MLRQFHKKMTLLYTLTTGIILSCVLIIIFIYSEKLLNLRNEETFQSGILSLISTLQSEHTLSDTWLAQMEAEYNFIIHIEENGTPLLFQGSWKPDTDRKILIQMAKDFAAENNINTSTALVSSDIQKSEIFYLTGTARDRYQSIVIKISTTNSYLNLILLHSLKPLQKALLGQRCLFILLDLFGFLALFFVSWCFVKKNLRPIRENKEKQDAFFAAASHELRSPIAVIQASANAISVNPSETSHLTGNILSECHRLSRLTEDMLTLSRANTSNWSANLSPLDLDTLLLDTFEAFEPICREKGLTLRLNLPDNPLPAINGDRERLLQLFTILLDNAISHSFVVDHNKKQDSFSSNTTDYNLISKNNYVDIKAFVSRRKVVIQIIDYGIGIPDDQKPLIFDHFYKGDTSRGDKSHFGLGLGIALELTKLHHGELTVTDTEGGGATFQLSLLFEG